MAVASLTKLTVPLASDQSQSTQGLLMPKLKYRFRVTFDGFGTSNSVSPTTEMTKQVMDFTRPTVNFEEITIPIYNSTIKLAGKHSWNDVTCNLRDDASGQVTRLVGEQLQKQLDFAEQASAAAGIDYKFTTILQILDGGNGANEPVVLEQWEMYGCYLKEVNYGDVNYGSSEVVTVALSISYDNAMQINSATGQPDGVGSSTGARPQGSVATGPSTVI
jgi:hypothetical protein